MSTSLNSLNTRNESTHHFNYVYPNIMDEFNGELQPWNKPSTPNSRSTSHLSEPKKSETSTYVSPKEPTIDENFYNTLLQLLLKEEFETGIVNESEKYVSAYYEKNDTCLTLTTLNALFINSLNKPHILIGILHLLSHSEYEKYFPVAQTMVLSVLNHTSAEVEEYAIKCFENWQNKETIKHLKSLTYSQKWLEEYVEQVIADLELL